jgi:hypothetical protein
LVWANTWRGAAVTRRRRHAANIITQRRGRAVDFDITLSLSVGSKGVLPMRFEMIFGREIAADRESFLLL